MDVVLYGLEIYCMTIPKKNVLHCFGLVNYPIIVIIAKIVVIVIPSVVRMYVELIHELSEWIILRTSGQTWYKYFIPSISV